MHTIKRFNLGVILLLTSMILFSTNIFAQQGQRKEQGPPPMPTESQINKMVDDLSVELSLSETQKTEILTLYTEHFADVKELSDGQRPSREEMESLRSEFEDDVKSLLNDEQQDLFEEFIKNNKPQQGKGRQR